MRRGAFERRLRDELAAVRPPRATEAERRAWDVVHAAHAGQLPVRRPRRGRLIAAVAAAAALAVALALTPAGAKVGGWIGDVVDPAPKTSRSTLASLPSNGRLLVVADSGAWIVQDDGAKRRLGSFRDATWSPGGLYVAAARGRELVALEPDGAERWTLPAPRRVTAPRWSPDGFRIAYLSGSDLYVTIADNTARWALARDVRPVAPAWQPGRPDGQQVLAYARGERIEIARVDPARPPRALLGRTAPGPVALDLWWSDDGRLIAVSERSVRTFSARGELLRTVILPGDLRASGSALAPDGRRLALIAAAPGARSSELLLLRTGRGAPPRRRLGGFGRLEGLTWSIDGRVLVAGLPTADQWLFLRLRGSGGLESVKRIRAQFGGGRPARTGAFPRPAGWCYREPADRDPLGQPPCSSGGGTPSP